MPDTDQLTYEGQCQCGAVKFRADGKPNWVLHCHCEDCRRSTASAFTTFAGFNSDLFEWRGAEPAAYESSPNVFRRFCSTCGTCMSYESDRFPGEVHIFVATLADPNSLSPTGHVYASEQLDWVHLSDGLDRFAKSSGADHS